MFEIYVTIKNNNIRTGLTALDLCRRLGLPDSAKIAIVRSDSPLVSVDEGFARLYFQADNTRVSQPTATEYLIPGDLCSSGQKDGWDISKMPAERVKALWLAAFHAKVE